MRLLIPPLTQALVPHHWSRGHDRRGQSADGDDKLDLIERLAQHVECT